MRYIVKIESYQGEGSTRTQDRNPSGRDEYAEWEQAEELYAIVKVEDGRATIVDDGYHSREEAEEAWPDAK
jgi:hypothetical protein